MHKRRSPPIGAKSRGNALKTAASDQPSDVRAKTWRQALLGARSALEREFRELFEAGAELPAGAKVQVENVVDRIAAYLERLERGDPLVVTELLLLAAPGADRGEALLAALLIDAEVDAEFRGPGVMRHLSVPRRSDAERRLTAMRKDVEVQHRATVRRADVVACERVMQLSIHLGGEWLRQMQQRCETQPWRLRREIERRMRAGQNPMRLLGDQLNQIVRASAECLQTDDR
ncbi:MAG: hypothetical protein U1E76_04115 [Planctomycetota bacterium]